ncbi:MAG: FAD-binding oxidoreductase [Candidatus Helarchaeota archaeon]|nr:FAD-binding oxidoreductase [Candidatus Helarchaeota archaeon]
MPIDRQALSNDLTNLVGAENVIIDDYELINYGLDRFDREHTPLMVVMPSSLSHLKRLNFILRRYKIDSITPRGFGLGINLGAFSNDLIIDLTLLNKKLNLDTKKLILTAQAGISYMDIQRELIKEGFHLPIEPILDGSLGGFIASGGYGYGSYRYGSVMSFLRSTTLFLSNGEMIQSGIPQVPPTSSGYNLNSLVCGSEGYFGIVIEAVLEIIPLASYSFNFLLSIRNSTDLPQLITNFNNLKTLRNVSLYKGIINDNSSNLSFLLRLEGSNTAVEQDYSSLQGIQELNLGNPKDANKLWENRIIDPAQIPASNMVIETIIPTNQLSRFFKFWEASDSPSYFGILLNANNILLYMFLTESMDNLRKTGTLTEFLKKSSDFYAYPPTIGNNIKKFVKKDYRNLHIIKQLKPIFDITNRLKSKELRF